MKSARLITMVNQIARNFAANGEANAIKETAEHIVSYWDPRMQAAILDGELHGLSSMAQAAIERLRAS